MFKRLPLYLFSSLLFMSFASAGQILVSDFDDTIRHTNASNAVDMIRNILTKRKVFTAMPELINSMYEEVEKVYVLTGSPGIVRGNARRLMRRRNVKYDTLIMNTTFNRLSTHDYKKNHLKRLMQEHPDSSFIYIGDDQGGDPEIYADIAHEYPGRVDAIYIRAVKNREIPQGVRSFVTAYEIALWEMSEERIESKKVFDILDTIYEARKFKVTIPKFAHCPKDESFWSHMPFKNLLSEYINFINKKCSRRRR